MIKIINKEFSMKKLFLIMVILVAFSALYADEVIQNTENGVEYQYTVVEKPFVKNLEEGLATHPDETYFDSQARNYIKPLKKGVCLDSFKMTFKPAVAKAKELGFDVVELSSLADLNLLRPLSDAQVAMIKSECDGIKINSLGANVNGLDIPAGKEYATRVANLKTLIDNAVKLGVNLVIFDMGSINFNQNDTRYKGIKPKVAKASYSATNLAKAMKELDAYCYAKGVKQAIKTKASSGYLYVDFINKNGLKATFVSFDPASLVMYGRDEIKSLKECKGYIYDVRIRDGLRESYGGGLIETPAGGGDVKWNDFLHTLQEIGYYGPLIVERDLGDYPTQDIINAVYFLYGVKPE